MEDNLKMIRLSEVNPDMIKTGIRVKSLYSGVSGTIYRGTYPYTRGKHKSFMFLIRWDNNRVSIGPYDDDDYGPDYWKNVEYLGEK
jgi:hypothetical protein